jgi:hypothetical protein
MAGLVLYSANPWIAHEIAMKYRKGVRLAWCSEYYDPTTEAATSAAAAIAPSSSPCGIVQRLKSDCGNEDTHSHLISGYRKTFKRLAKVWRSNGEIDESQYQEIVSVLKSSSWKIWRPVLYVIPRAPIESAGRLRSVPHAARAAYGPELQIVDLQPNEFDLIVVPC